MGIALRAWLLTCRNQALNSKALGCGGGWHGSVKRGGGWLLLRGGMGHTRGSCCLAAAAGVLYGSTTSRCGSGLGGGRRGRCRREGWRPSPHGCELRCPPSPASLAALAALASFAALAAPLAGCCCCRRRIAGVAGRLVGPVPLPLGAVPGQPGCGEGCVWGWGLGCLAGCLIRG